VLSDNVTLCNESSEATWPSVEQAFNGRRLHMAVYLPDMRPLIERAVRRYHEDGALAVLRRGFRRSKKRLRPRRRTWDTFWEVYNLYSRGLRGRSSLSFMDADWDNMLILDACSYDSFEQFHSLPGDLSARYSPGSSTSEFLEKTIEGRTFPNTVCITANPKYSLHEVEDNFHATVSVWQHDWDEEHPSLVKRETA